MNLNVYASMCFNYYKMPMPMPVLSDTPPSLEKLCRTEIQGKKMLSEVNLTITPGFRVFVAGKAISSSLSPLSCSPQHGGHFRHFYWEGNDFQIM